MTPVVVQFAVAAVSDRRNLWNQKTAVRDRRYKESNCTTTLTPPPGAPRGVWVYNRKCEGPAMKRLLFAMMILGYVQALVAQTEPSTVLPPFEPPETLSVSDIPLPVLCVEGGIVVLDAPITKAGEFQRVEVRRDMPCLTPLAVHAVEGWKFSPATFAGKAIASRMPVAVTFNPPGLYPVPTPATLPALKPQADAAIQAEFQPAEVIHAAFPDYPGSAVAFGTVVLEVTLSKKGEAEEVKVLRDRAPFTAEAKAVVGDWRFMPATINGAPLRSNILLAFVFSAPVSTSSLSHPSSSNGHRAKASAR